MRTVTPRNRGCSLRLQVQKPVAAEHELFRSLLRRESVRLLHQRFDVRILVVAAIPLGTNPCATGESEASISARALISHGTHPDSPVAIRLSSRSEIWLSGPG